MATCDLRLAATGLVVVLALGGCSGEQNVPSAAPVSPSVATPTMSSTPTPSPATAQERAAVDAVLATSGWWTSWVSIPHPTLMS